MRKPLSPESYASRNLNDDPKKPLESDLASSRDVPEEIHSCVRIESRGFESLLQRAMEILSARERSAAASSS